MKAAFPPLFENILIIGFFGSMSFLGMKALGQQPSNEKHTRKVLDIRYRASSVDPVSLPNSLGMIRSDRFSFMPDLVCTDQSRTIFISDVTAMGYCQLKRFDRNGRFLEAWKPVSEDAFYQGAVSSHGYIWMACTGQEFRGLPIVVYRAGRSSPVIDWRDDLSPPVQAAISRALNDAKPFVDYPPKQTININGDPAKANLSDKVTNAIAADTRIRSADIHMSMSPAGWLQLSGTVDTQTERQAAEQDAKAFPGSVHVDNNIQVVIKYVYWCVESIESGAEKVALQLTSESLGHHGRIASTLWLLVSEDGQKVFEAKSLKSGQTLAADGTVWVEDSDFNDYKWNKVWFYREGATRGEATLDRSATPKLFRGRFVLPEDTTPLIQIDALGHRYFLWTSALTVTDRGGRFIDFLTWTKPRGGLYPISDGSGYYTSAIDETQARVILHPLAR